MSLIDEINKIYFVVLWVIASLIFFHIYMHVTGNKAKNNIANGFPFALTSTSILGAIYLICSNFIEDYTKNTPFETERFYVYIASLMIIWVSFIGMKSQLKKDKVYPSDRL